MDQHSEQKFTAWAAGKPLAVSVLAEFAVETIGPLREFMEYRRTSVGPFALEPAADLYGWLKFCRRKALVRSFCELFFGPEVGFFVYRSYLALENPTAASPAELYCAWVTIIAAFSEYKTAADDLELPSSPAEEIEDDGLPDEVMECPIMQFAMRTAVPCWFVYGVLPHQLLWNVWGDDQELAEESVERLVRLDPKVVHHPIIQHWIKSDPKLLEFRTAKVREWQRRRTPFNKPNESYWLRAVFGLLSSLSDLYDHRLKEPELRELAEILKCEVPEDLMEYVHNKTNDDLSREIRRYRGHFLVSTKPDKSIYALVREVLKKAA